MLFEQKKDHVLRLIQLGMEYSRAVLLADLSIDEIEQLDNDLSFQEQVKVRDVLLEYELLELHNEAMENAVKNGNASAIQWKLAKVNADRWGNKEKDNKPVARDNIQIILPSNGRRLNE